MQEIQNIAKVKDQIDDQQTYWGQCFVDNCDFTVQYYEMNDGVQILVVHSQPKTNPTSDVKPVILIPGWFSLPNGWVDVLRPLTPHTEVYYIETREKSSSKISNKKVSFSVDQMADDFAQLLRDLNINLKSSIIMGSSLGGSMLIKYFSETKNYAAKAVLVSPNPDYKLPPVLGKLLLAMPLFMFKVVKKYVKWHVLTFKIDKKKEPDQARKYEEVLDAADPWKLRKSAREVVKFNGWDMLANIDAEIILIGASSDKLHGFERSEKIADLLPKSEIVDFGSNKAIHEEEFGNFLLKLARKN